MLCGFSIGQLTTGQLASAERRGSMIGRTWTFPKWLLITSTSFYVRIVRTVLLGPVLTQGKGLHRCMSIRWVGTFGNHPRGRPSWIVILIKGKLHLFNSLPWSATHYLAIFVFLKEKNYFMLPLFSV
jgi:hypothetical protein